MEEKNFLQGISIIEALTGKVLSPEQEKLYRVLLDDIPDEDFVTGINVMLRERVYTNFPMPAEIREYCLQTRDEDLDIRVANARTKLKNAINRVGTYNSVVFDDPILHLVVRDFGGWVKLGSLSLKEYEDLLKWELPKLYKAYALRKNREIPLVLTGRSPSDTITYVGNPEKAQRWIASYQKALGNEGTTQSTQPKLCQNIKTIGNPLELFKK